MELYRYRIADGREEGKRIAASLSLPAMTRFQIAVLLEFAPNHKPCHCETGTQTGFAIRPPQDSACRFNYI